MGVLQSIASSTSGNGMSGIHVTSSIHAVLINKALNSITKNEDHDKIDEQKNLDLNYLYNEYIDHVTNPNYFFDEEFNYENIGKKIANFDDNDYQCKEITFFKLNNEELSGNDENEITIEVTEYAPKVFKALRVISGVCNDGAFIVEWDIYNVLQKIIISKLSGFQSQKFMTPERNDNSNCTNKIKIPSDNKQNSISSPTGQLQQKLELGEGRSQALFLRSRQLSFMCKTIGEAEATALLENLRKYTEYLKGNFEFSALLKFLLLMKVTIIKKNKKRAHRSTGFIVCFADVFKDCDVLHERWDLKGRIPKPGKYRYFPDLEYRYHYNEKTASETFLEVSKTRENSHQQSNLLVNVRNQPNLRLSTRKDKDLSRMFWLDFEPRELLVHHLDKDFEFLASLGFMDYSLLVGVRYNSPLLSSIFELIKMICNINYFENKGNHILNHGAFITNLDHNYRILLKIYENLSNLVEIYNKKYNAIAAEINPPEGLCSFSENECPENKAFTDGTSSPNFRRNTLVTQSNSSPTFASSLRMKHVMGEEEMANIVEVRKKKHQQHKISNNICNNNKSVQQIVPTKEMPGKDFNVESMSEKKDNKRIFNHNSFVNEAKIKLDGKNGSTMKDFFCVCDSNAFKGCNKKMLEIYQKIISPNFLALQKGGEVCASDTLEGTSKIKRLSEVNMLNCSIGNMTLNEIINGLISENMSVSNKYPYTNDSNDSIGISIKKNSKDIANPVISSHDFSSDLLHLLQDDSSSAEQFCSLLSSSSFRGGVNSVGSVETYYIGIIDILTPYTWKKTIANSCKSCLWQSETLSSIPPLQYCRRIKNYVHHIFPSVKFQHTELNGERSES